MCGGTRFDGQSEIGVPTYQESWHAEFMHPIGTTTWPKKTSLKNTDAIPAQEAAQFKARDAS
jgi:hypothetical protein